MSERKKVIFLIGSPRGAKSTSVSLSTYLRSKIQNEDFGTSMFHARKMVQSAGEFEKFLSDMDNADILVLASPLYVDALPYPVVKLMEGISERRKKTPALKRLRILAIVNSGFPEVRHNDTALAICRTFAKEAGLEWVGGLALGGGHVIDGRPLEKCGRPAKGVKKSLDMAADALVGGRPLPEEAVSLMSRSVVPRWLYLWMGEMGGRRTARKNGVMNNIDDRPYER